MERGTLKSAVSKFTKFRRLVRFIKPLVIYFKLPVGLTSNYFLFMDLVIIIAFGL